MTPASRALRERLRAQTERRLSPEEWAARAAVPITDVEREEVLSLARWFRARYPTPLERLAYVRRAYGRWAATQGLAYGSTPGTAADPPAD